MTSTFSPLQSLTGRARVLTAGLAAGLLLATGSAQAQSDYPSKSVHLVVSLAPGGPADVLTRLIGDRLSKIWNQPVVVENKPGAGGNLAAAQVARTAGDGYTLLSTLDSVFTVNPSLYPNLGFETRDLVPVSNPASNGLMLVANPALGAKSVADLVTRSKTRSLNYSSAGNGTPAHLATVLLARSTGMEATHIPYKGAAPAVLAVLSGEVDIGILPVPAVLQHVNTGKLVAVAVTGRQRSVLAPSVPTLSESGVKNADVSVSYGIFAPAATPAAVIGKIHKDIATVMAQPDVKERLAKMDISADAVDGKQFADDLAATGKRWTEALKGSGIKVD
ncbi:MAG: tripartite tricarboxylate transporter substrate-binding protein [Burkholderiaceae bacterium]